MPLHGPLLSIPACSIQKVPLRLRMKGRIRTKCRPAAGWLQLWQPLLPMSSPLLVLNTLPPPPPYITSLGQL